MSRRAEGAGPRRVAVGATREQAAIVFGLDHDEVFLTTYSDFEEEVVSDSAPQIDLASGTGGGKLVSSLLEIVSKGSPLRLRVEYVIGDPEQMLVELDSHPSIGLERVERLRERVVLTLAAMEPAEASASRLAIDALALVTPASRPNNRQSPASPAVDRAAIGAPTTAAEPEKRTAPPFTLRLLARLLSVLHASTRRRRAAALLLALALGLVLLVVVMFAVVHTEAGDTGVHVALGALTLGALGLMLSLQLLLQRDVYHQRIALERMLRGQRAVLRKRTDMILGYERAIRAGQKDLPFLLQYLETIDSTHSATRAQLKDWFDDNERVHRRLHLETQRQDQAVSNLGALVTLEGRVPPLGGWAASADLMVLVLDELLSQRPRTVVECGSGTSTLLLAMAVREHGLDTRIVALEHLPRFKDETEQVLAQHGLSDRVEVRLAPLEAGSVEGHATPWYSESALGDLEDIGLLLVDGPPTKTGHLARYPAIPLLRSKLAPDCVVVMDDLVRDSDHQVAEQWRRLLPDFEYELMSTLQKHAGVFRRRG